MNKIKILIIETGKYPKENRLFTGNNEWRDGWLFSDNYFIAYKIDDSDQLDYPKDLKKIKCDKNCIIWIKWQDDKKEVVNLLHPFLENHQNCEIYLTYHDSGLTRILLNKEVKIRPYSLISKNKNQFKKIIKDTPQKTHLNANAPFDDIFTCFFLNPPDVLAQVIHKVNGILSTLDLDLQTLLDCDFRDDIWSEIKKSYRYRNIKKDVEEWINGDETSLKKMVEQEKSRNKNIKKEFEVISSLFENNSIKPLDDILTGFKAGKIKAKKIDILRDNIEDFRDWYEKILKAFEKFIEIVKVNNEK